MTTNVLVFSYESLELLGNYIFLTFNFVYASFMAMW